MSITTETILPDDETHASRSEEPSTDPPGEVTIAERVLERIATHALGEVGQVGGVARRWLGVPIGSDSTETAPKVGAHIDGSLATLQMTVSVVYPAPVREVAGQVREVVAARVGQYTGLDVRQVDITIASFIEASASRRVV